jgi:hypothetical protein
VRGTRIYDKNAAGGRYEKTYHSIFVVGTFDIFVVLHAVLQIG